MLKGQLINEIHETCTSILTIKLQSDHLDQSNQIEDSDILNISIFKNLSVLSLSNLVLMKGIVPSLTVPSNSFGIKCPVLKKSISVGATCLQTEP